MEQKDKKLAQFTKFKYDSLNKKDLSLKGSIDEPIRHLVDIINRNDYYYTTSTCSGRITLLEKPNENPGIKKGSIFHLNSHTTVDLEHFSKIVKDFIDCDAKNNGTQCEINNCLWLKFEPFIIHVQCYDLDKARFLLNIALANGCRNSGITIGKPDKHMVAFRSTSSMEVPIYCSSKFEPPPQRYIDFLCTESNRRLGENLERLHKLQTVIESDL